MIFFKILKFYAQRYKFYKLEIIAVFLRRIYYLILLLWFWNIILKTSIDINTYIYFIIGSAIADLISLPGSTSNSFGRFIRKAIKNGEFSNYLLLPTNLILYGYALTLGQDIVEFLLGIIQITIGVGLLLIYKKITILRLLIFVPFFINAFLLSWAFNLFEASISFFFTEIKGIKNSLIHITRVLSGKIIPLYMLSSSLKTIILNLPFAHIIFFPSYVLITNIELHNIIYYWSIGLLWAIILNIIFYLVWKKGLTHYEAVGL